MKLRLWVWLTMSELASLVMMVGLVLSCLMV